MSDILNTLLKGRAEVVDHWGKGRAHGWDGSVCAIGAIENAAGIASRHGAVCLTKEGSLHPASLLLLRHLPTYYKSVPEFNDASETTREDVLALFDRTINAVAATTGVSDPAHVFSQVA